MTEKVVARMAKSGGPFPDCAALHAAPSGLHYETRVDGEAVDPQKFLRAGLRLGGTL